MTEGKMICPECDLENPANSNFCRHCGTQFLLASIISLAHEHQPYELVTDKNGKKWQWNSVRAEEIENLCEGTKYGKNSFKLAKFIIRGTMPQFKQIYAKLGINPLEKRQVTFPLLVGACYNRVRTPVTDEEKISKDIAIVWKINNELLARKSLQEAWLELSIGEIDYLRSHNISPDVIEESIAKIQARVTQKRVEDLLRLLSEI